MGFMRTAPVKSNDIKRDWFVVDAANQTHEVVQCFTTTGVGSHVLLIQTKNTSSLERLLRRIQSWPGVTRTETQLILNSYKKDNIIDIP